MLNWLKERQSRTRSARDLYGSIVSQARQPGLYGVLGVPDTAQGRFELIVLHTVLVLRRLQQDGDNDTTLARALSETFIVDMDDNMRELSFSDLAVPREVKKVAAALFDRHRAVSSALDTGNGNLEVLKQALSRDLAYLTSESQPSIRVAGLARYLEAAARALAAQSIEALSDAGPIWPDVAGFHGTEA